MMNKEIDRALETRIKREKKSKDNVRLSVA